MLDIYKQITIKTLHKQGVQPSVIAKQMGCHRNTISNVLHREKIIEKQTRVRSSSLDSYKEQIKGWRDKEITILRIHELLQENYGVQKSYDSLRKYIQKQFP
jgi:transposase